MKKNAIKTSWDTNAQEWIKALDSEQITSRKFTNEAIVAVLKNSKAIKILDMGCGEGWLSRAITSMGKSAVGIDATASLLANARKKGKEVYHHMSFEDIIEAKKIPNAPFDAAVFNFCIYQNKTLVSLLLELKQSVVEQGEIIIQTLHPYFLIQNQLPYQSQWIDDAWKGLAGNFTDGHQWYARTFEDWSSDFQKAGLVLNEIIEVNNDQQIPISVIFKTQYR
ncbi:bifunctional 2-polyprenyl-6-hydroxyphenol methylase/3-demethylubiquinol 3-O-methyltransferase UbiG [Cellulophaga sp. Hel_I_12]|uniref:class I SAM-dependent methyltransferase n=1 Tax=Cellulophaga sp. Hel_I_12 TaxID=1249972 RepID=UPI000646E6B0|nr:class I SAM-dependent methyltransferase [Cellulophaga sp. Hel_I_12]